MWMICVGLREWTGSPEVGGFEFHAQDLTYEERSIHIFQAFCLICSVTLVHGSWIPSLWTVDLNRQICKHWAWPLQA